MSELTATVWRDWPFRWMNRVHAQARLKDTHVFLMRCRQGEGRPGAEGWRGGIAARGHRPALEQTLYAASLPVLSPHRPNG
jgi:hypothetical protein